MTYTYNGQTFKSNDEAELAIMLDFPGAGDDELCDLFDIYIEEN